MQFHFSRHWKILLGLILIFVLMIGLIFSERAQKDPEAPLPTEEESTEPAVPSPQLTAFNERLIPLEKQIFTDDIFQSLGEVPAEEGGFIVFLTVCNGNDKSFVYSGFGNSLPNAWAMARENVEDSIIYIEEPPIWVKADVVNSVETISWEALSQELLDYAPGYYPYGIAFDPLFEKALLSEELNFSLVYNYDGDGMDLPQLNEYLTYSAIANIEQFPEEVTRFTCLSWFCDENKQVYSLSHDNGSNGHRVIPYLDQDLCLDLIRSGSDYLAGTVQDNNQYTYCYIPVYDYATKDYSIAHHAAATWAQICAYRAAPSPALKEAIDKSVLYLLGNIVYQDGDSAYLLDETTQEIQVSSCGLALVTLTEYMDVFDTSSYKDLAQQLGNGILKMMDPETGSFQHILEADFTPREEYRSESYDAQALLGLAHLYRLTQDQKWLDASCLAADRLAAQYSSDWHPYWLAYAMNELTACCPDRQDYYEFAMELMDDNMESAAQATACSPAWLEFYMNSFETCLRMAENGYAPEDFDLSALVQAIQNRAASQLTAFVFPEYAMYLQKPNKVVGAFCSWDKYFRVQISDIQENLGGLCLFYQNYENLTSCGYPVSVEG